MNIRWAEIDEYPAVVGHYAACGYGGGLNTQDGVLVAVEQDNIIGAVRICREQGVKLLRGMYIKQAFRGKGIGLAMLLYLEAQEDMAGCYCLPYGNLVRFYGNIGFEEISIAEAPGFLVDRLERYRNNGNRDIIIMQIK
jgi:GNAT superfamily N-acetyltransferase